MSTNKKDRSEYLKEYFKKNKERLTEEYQCEICQGHYKKVHKTIHEKTKKHQSALLILNLQKDNQNMKNIITDIGKKIEKI